MYLNTNIISVIALYTDYETTMHIITMNKEMVKSLANSYRYFWKRKYYCENKLLPKEQPSVHFENWAIRYMIKTKKYCGKLYRKLELQSNWKLLLKNVWSVSENIAITDEGLYAIDKKPKYINNDSYICNDINHVLKYGDSIYGLKDDGKVFLLNISEKPYIHYILNLPYIISMHLSKNNNLVFTTRKLVRYELLLNTNTLSKKGNISVDSLTKVVVSGCNYICTEGILHSIYDDSIKYNTYRISYMSQDFHLTLDKKLLHKNIQISIDNMEKILYLLYNDSLPCHYALCI